MIHSGVYKILLSETFHQGDKDFKKKAAMFNPNNIGKHVIVSGWRSQPNSDNPLLRLKKYHLVADTGKKSYPFEFSF